MVYEREQNVLVRHITAGHYFLSPISNTFHGRDIFAPVAAWLGKSMQTEPFGEEITDFVRFSIPRPKTDGVGLKGVVLRVDVFGNLLTNFTAEDLPAGSVEEGKVKLKVGGKGVQRFVQTFAQGAAGEPIALLGSSGFLEVAVNKGNAARALAVNRGAEVILETA
jgi:S-adenosylmethionine hydrolase